jgi:membrane protein implicated in regulation of membrane protease activity
MYMSTTAMWSVAAAAAVAVELATGTFYLLMMATGLAAAALAAALGLTTALQVTVAAVVGGGATAALHWRRAHHPTAAPARENRDMNLDIGATVKVPAWGEDRTARVSFRGSEWTARLDPDAPSALPGPHRIVAIEGNWLVLGPSGIHSPAAPPARR